MSADVDAMAAEVVLLMKSVLAPVLDRIKDLEARMASAAGESALAALTEFGAIRERVAVLEVKAPVPGPAGKDGVDGLGWDDLVVEHDGERGFVVKMRQGAVTKDCGAFTIPAMLYRGIWEAKAYDPGDVVTWAGSSWHCQKPTTTKPDSFEGAAFWKLMVKRGDRGKDAK
jgi:hypothetical protein